MNRIATTIILGLAVLTGAARAQLGGRIDLSWSRITDGGGVWSGVGSGGIELRGTIGQWDAGEMAGGPLSLLTGNWGQSSALPPGPGSCQPGWKYGLDQGIPGITQLSYAVTTWDPDGSGPTPEWLIVGGNFAPAVVGDIFANGIAAWDGTAWHDLSGGIQGQVFDLLVFNGDLIVAGTLNQAGSATVSGIARFDGTTWHAMDTGFGNGAGGTGVVWALTIYQGQLIAAGSFSQASGLATSNIARWNGATWEALGFGITGQEVRALAVLGNDLYAGGVFNIAGGVSANYIARWNGSWSPLGVGVGADVYALEPLANGTLAVGGAFLQAGGMPADHLAIWATGGGGVWQNPFGAGNLGSYVFTLREMNGHLLIGGGFTPSLSIRNIVSWRTGDGFQSVGYGTDAAVWDIGSFGGKPVIVGGFRNVGPASGVPGQPTVAWGVAIFDSTLCPVPACPIIGGWRRLTPGIDGTIEAMAVSGGELFAGGYPFSSAGMVNPTSVARWNGNSWNTTVGSTPPVPPAQLPGTAYGPSFYPGAAVVAAIVDYQGTPIIAGQFNDPAFPTQNITSWHGTNSFWGNLFFDPFNGSQDLNAFVYALTTWDPDGPGLNMGLMLIAGGEFTAAGRNALAVPASRIGGFRSTQWTAFGAGVNGAVKALAVYNGDLIVGGNFTQAGGAPADHIARLHYTGGTGQPDIWTWSPMSAGINFSVFSLATYNGSLYAGGQFSSAGGVPVANIARWDGAAWHPVGDGLGAPFNSPVLALATYRGELYAGGQFGGSFGPGGNVFMANIGRWDGAAWHPLDGGINGIINTMTEYQGRLLVGGGFTNVNGRVSHSWARWEPDVIAPTIADGAFPSGYSATCGQDVGFGVTVAYGTSPGFRWRRNGVPLFDGATGTGSTIQNAATPGLTIRNISYADAGQYDCIVSNTCGSVTSAAAALSVCFANCDCSTTPPALNVLDFACFLNKFAAGDPSANCDGSTTPPVLNVRDFACFLNNFAAGCP